VVSCRTSTISQHQFLRPSRWTQQGRKADPWTILVVADVNVQNAVRNLTFSARAFGSALVWGHSPQLASGHIGSPKFQDVDHRKDASVYVVFQFEIRRPDAAVAPARELLYAQGDQGG